jgi:hypothetical protein
MWEALQKPLWRSPTVLYTGRSEIRAACAVEVALQVVLPFPSFDDIHLLRISSAVAAIIIFFKDEVVASFEPGLHDRLKDLISIHL